MPGRTKKSRQCRMFLFSMAGHSKFVHPYGCQGDAEGAKKLLLECKQMYAKVSGKDHKETLDAARPAQNAGLECDDGVHSGFT